MTVTKHLFLVALLTALAFAMPGKLNMPLPKSGNSRTIEEIPTINPMAPHGGTVIYLSGEHTRGRDMVSMFAGELARRMQPVKFMFPVAYVIDNLRLGMIPLTLVPNERVQLLDAKAMSGIPAKGYAVIPKEDEVMASVQDIHHLIDMEISMGVDPEKIILMGHFDAGYSYPQKLGGIIPISGKIPDHSLIDEYVSKAGMNVPFLWIHGARDKTVPVAKAEEEFKKLLEIDLPGEFYKASDGVHFAGPQMIDRIVQFLGTVYKIRPAKIGL